MIGENRPSLPRIPRIVQGVSLLVLADYLAACGRNPEQVKILTACASPKSDRCFTLKVTYNTDTLASTVAAAPNGRYISNINESSPTSYDFALAFAQAGLMPMAADQIKQCATSLPTVPNKLTWVTQTDMDFSCYSTLRSLFVLPEATATSTAIAPTQVPEQAALESDGHWTLAVGGALGLLALGSFAAVQIRKMFQRPRPAVPTAIVPRRETVDVCVTPEPIFDTNDIQHISDKRARKLAGAALSQGKTGFMIHSSSDRGYYIV